MPPLSQIISPKRLKLLGLLNHWQGSSALGLALNKAERKEPNGHRAQ
jgi:hypothetical protein